MTKFPVINAKIPMKQALAGSSDWPVQVVAVGVVDSTSNQIVHGASTERLEWASVTKLITALATLVAIEEHTINLNDEVGPPGATLLHLLAHASGLNTDTHEVLAPPATRRIYSNTGYEIIADHVARKSEMPFIDYLNQAVLEPLEMNSTRLEGSPAWGARGSIVDLLKFATELLTPTIISPATLGLATSVAVPGLAGVLPGFGDQNPNDWGLGFELRDGKSPHWTGRENSTATFGHFGRAGGFLWVDPVEQLACGSLSDRAFGPWATRAWPTFSNAILKAWRDQSQAIA